MFNNDGKGKCELRSLPACASAARPRATSPAILLFSGPVVFIPRLRHVGVSTNRESLMSTFFTDAFKAMPPEEVEAFYNTVFMHMDTPYAAELRRQYYKPLLRRMGENVRIGCGVKILNPQYVSLGNNVAIADHCTILAKSERGISLDDASSLQYGVYLDTEGATGYIEIGKKVYVGTGCCFFGHKGLEIGDDTLFAQNITITPYSHIFEDPDKPIIQQGGYSRRVTIGRDCYIGKSCSILYSADIGDGCVVGSGSVVVKPLPPFSVAVGVPAQVIRKRGEPKPVRETPAVPRAGA